MHRIWLVEFHAEAVAELIKLRDPKQRKGVTAVVNTLRQKGPELSAPHMKRVTGTSKLCELRPGSGTVPVRPLYLRFDQSSFKVMAIGPEAIVDPSGFRAAVERARRRAHDDYGISV
jgi:hypothetical protein